QLEICHRHPRRSPCFGRASAFCQFNKRGRTTENDFNPLPSFSTSPFASFRFSECDLASPSLTSFPPLPLYSGPRNGAAFLRANRRAPLPTVTAPLTVALASRRLSRGRPPSLRP